MQRRQEDTMNNTDISETCKQIMDEADAIIKYTYSMEQNVGDTSRAIFEEIRNDELEHLQKLVVMLTEAFSGEEPTEADKMDSSGRADGFGNNMGDKTIIIQLRDTSNSIQDLLEYLMGTANIGHTFDVVVDPDNKDHEKKFEIDGDGSDFFYSIESEDTYSRGEGE
jgi:rubrerythrin